MTPGTSPADLLAVGETSAVAEFRVEGPVQAEVFLVWEAGDHVELTGPCGAAPWYMEVQEDEDPLEVVTRVVTEAVGPPLIVHSTSWRRDRRAVILSFLVVIEGDLVGDRESRPVVRAELARNEATAAPDEVSSDQVVEHALRHLAWLAAEDPVVSEELSDSWKALLAGWVPEPFRNLIEPAGGAAS